MLCDSLRPNAIKWGHLYVYVHIIIYWCAHYYIAVTNKMNTGLILYTAV